MSMFTLSVECGDKPAADFCAGDFSASLAVGCAPNAPKLPKPSPLLQSPPPPPVDRVGDIPRDLCDGDFNWSLPYMLKPLPIPGLISGFGEATPDRWVGDFRMSAPKFMLSPWKLASLVRVGDIAVLRVVGDFGPSDWLGEPEPGGKGTLAALTGV